MAVMNNSFARKDDNDDKRPDFEERKKDLTQYSDVKQIKKKEENAVWKWVRDMFFSGRTLKEIVMDVTENQIVPQVKDNFRNSLVTMLDLSIYKDHDTRSTSSTPGSFVTNYVKFSDSGSKQKAALEENKKKEQEVIKSGFEMPAFREKVKADNFLKDMKAYVMKYHTMSVFDLAWMQGKQIDYTWDKYVWNEEEILAIKAPVHVGDPQTPWAIMLPKAHEMD